MPIPAGTKVIMSPAHKAYLDMNYHEAAPIGLNWAANIEVPRGGITSPTPDVSDVTPRKVK